MYVCVHAYYVYECMTCGCVCDRVYACVLVSVGVYMCEGVYVCVFVFLIVCVSLLPLSTGHP